jgi:hypothetical protein
MVQIDDTYREKDLLCKVRSIFADSCDESTIIRDEVCPLLGDCKEKLASRKNSDMGFAFFMA